MILIEASDNNIEIDPAHSPPDFSEITKIEIALNIKKTKELN